MIPIRSQTPTARRPTTRRGSTVEVPRRFLSDNTKDIRAARKGKVIDWAALREERRRKRAEWLDFYEEAERREKGIEKPLEVAVPESEVARAVAQGVYVCRPNALAERRKK